jgi:hypothetical protein
MSVCDVKARRQWRTPGPTDTVLDSPALYVIPGLQGGSIMDTKDQDKVSIQTAAVRREVESGRGAT